MSTQALHETTETTPSYVTDVTGEVRMVWQTWADGSYTCPFCGAGVVPTDRERPCPNPCCAASPRADADEVCHERQEAAERERERVESAARSASIAESMRRSRERRDAEVTAAVAEGFCRRCFVRSGHRKRVRHRTPDYHGRTDG